MSYLNRSEAIKMIKNNPELIKLMAEFKRSRINETYILIKEIENEEELALHWLSELGAKKQ